MSLLAQYDAVPPADVKMRLKLVSHWIRSAPRPFFAELRERRPIFRTPAFTLLTRYRDVLDVLHQPGSFSVRLYGMKLDKAMGPFMLGRDNQEQNYRDKSIMRLVMPYSDLPRVRRMIRRVTQALLPSTLKEVDLVATITRQVPVTLCDEYFGFSGLDSKTMLEWSKAMQTNIFKNMTNDQAIEAGSVAAGQQMKRYLSERLEMNAASSARCEEEETIIDRLGRYERAGLLPLDRPALIVNLAGLLVGAVETTSQAVAQALRQILLRPQIRGQAIEAASREDSAEFDAIIWESLRFDPINPVLPRYTELPTTIGTGTDHQATLGTGTVVLASTASAMWDESVIENSDQFVPGRPDSHYLHFGVGTHECLGSQMGRVMISEMMRCILQREPTLIDGPGGEIQFRESPFPESFQVKLER